MRILDWYLLKRYLRSFFFTLMVFIPIAIAIDVSEKIDKFITANLGFAQVVQEYYLNFIIYYSNTFLPLALFISVIMFTSKLASQTEIVAINSAQISFTRFLYPYLIGSVVVCGYALFMNHYIVPATQKEFIQFEQDYLKKKKGNQNRITDVGLQLDKDNYIFMTSFNPSTGRGNNFTYERYEGLKLAEVIGANSIKILNDSTYRLNSYKKRIIDHEGADFIESGLRMDTIFSFKAQDLEFSGKKSRELTTPELNEFINTAERRGVKNLNNYYVERYQRTSLPFSAFILTLIAVSLSSKKKRGGLGVNLAIGIGLMFLYVFFMKVGTVLGSVAGANAMLYVWMPNIMFGILSIYLYIRAKN